MSFIKFFPKLSMQNTAIAGGKGASLGEMTRAGIPVPPGFVVLSSAFERFLDEADLCQEIDAELSKCDKEKMHTIEHASERIQKMILEAKIPSDIREAVMDAYQNLSLPCKGEVPESGSDTASVPDPDSEGQKNPEFFVAVRSSATAEDSQSAAWAGQLDSFLNTTEENLLENVKRCWASLFTPRAIFYRMEQFLSPPAKGEMSVRGQRGKEKESFSSFSPPAKGEMSVRGQRGKEKESFSSFSPPAKGEMSVRGQRGFPEISVAVVIQTMIQSEISGIAFSVHPVTEDPDQMIIEAGYGLGEAIVSGTITPDSYVVSKKEKIILDTNIAEQEKMLVRAARTHTDLDPTQTHADTRNHWIPVPEKNRTKQKLTEDQILELSEIIKRIENHYAFPCDIEWAFACPERSRLEGGKFYILQSRPITTLKNLKDVDLCTREWQSLKLYNYQKMFQWNGNFSYFLNSFFMGVYEDLEVLSIFDGIMWQSYIPLSVKKKTLFEGITLYGDKKKYSKLKKSLSFEYKKLENLFTNILKKTTLSEDDVVRCFEGSVRYYKYYSKTEFFYTDEAFQEQEENIEAKNNFSSFGSLKMTGRNQLNQLCLVSDNYFDRLIQKIGKQFEVDFGALKSYSMQEIINLFKDASKVSQKTISKRERSYFSRGKGSHFESIFSFQAKRIARTFLKGLKYNQGLSGQTANGKGKTIGTARILTLSIGEIEKTSEIVERMQKGEILVAETTAPEIVTACKKALAIVTNQGDMLSHAAIISRELGISCIVGTGYATQVLHDGDLVEVDADKGVVRILERAGEGNTQGQLITTSRDDKNESKKEGMDRWSITRTRYIPALYPLLSLFDWDCGKYFGLQSSGHIINVWKNGNYFAIWEKAKQLEFGDAIVQLLLKDKDLQKIRETSFREGASLVDKVKLFALDTEPITFSRYKNFLADLSVAYARLVRDNLILWLLGGFYIERRLGILLREYPENIQKNIIGKYSHPKEKTMTQNIEDEREKIIGKACEWGMRDKRTLEMIKEFSQEYFWFPYEYAGPEIWNEEYLAFTISQEIEKRENRGCSSKSSAESENIPSFRSLPNEAKNLFEILQLFGVLQDDRKIFNAQVSYYINTVLAERVALSFGISADDARYLDVNAINILENNKEALFIEMEDRKELFLVDQIDGKYISRTGSDVSRYLNDLGIVLDASKEKDQREFKGQSAYGGCVVGRVRVMRTSQEVGFEKDNVLVTGMTTPDFIPLIKRASAIITNEGGITCHAAIVSRELKKPCIIGTKIATQVLKDGDLVEVDADKGVVRILERAKKEKN